MARPASRRRLLAAVFAHPDDESLFAGGLLATAARSGAEVNLLCLTRGDAGWSRFGERGDALAARRVEEIARACAALGIQPAEVWTLPDGGLAHADADAITASVARWLSDLQPDAVVTFGADGAYGHADHIACGAFVRDAMTAHFPGTRLLETAFATGTFAALRRNLERFVPPELLPIDASQLGSDPHEDDLQLTLTTELSRTKRAAVAAHDSQLPGGDPDRFLAPKLVQTLCAHERYRVAQGPGFDRLAPTNVFAGLA